MSLQVDWILHEQVLSRLKSAIPINVSFVGSEDSKELIQSSIVMAVKLLDNADKQNEKCKLRCPRCHYFMSCPDFDFAG
jgi:hypothetical protein